jgi:hypothetical protein
MLNNRLPKTPWLDSQGALTPAGKAEILMLREVPQVEVLRLWLEYQMEVLARPQQFPEDKWTVHSCQHEGKKHAIYLVASLLDKGTPLMPPVQEGTEDFNR